MKDLDELTFMEKSILTKIYLKEMKESKKLACFGLYNNSLDAISFFYNISIDKNYVLFLQFIYVVNHEFLHRILNQFINVDTCRKLDNFTSDNHWVDFEELLPHGFLKWVKKRNFEML